MKYEVRGNEATEKEASEKQKMYQQITDLMESFSEKPEQIAEYLDFAEKFSYQYSARNTMLIYKQNMGAQFCQSYAAWKSQGYSVLRGQHGMNIYTPVTYTILHLPDGGTVPLRSATKEQREMYKQGILPGEKGLGYKIGKTFDVAQTNFPKEQYPELLGRGFFSEEHRQCVEELIEFSEEELHCPVVWGEKEDVIQGIGLFGYYRANRTDQEIHLSSNLEDTKNLLTLVHELGHAILHNPDSMPDRKIVPSCRKEFEADCMRFLLCRHLGFELDDHSLSHMQENFLAMNQMKEDGREKVGSPLESFQIVFLKYREYLSAIDRYLEQHCPGHLPAVAGKDFSAAARKESSAPVTGEEKEKTEKQKNAAPVPVR